MTKNADESFERSDAGGGRRGAGAAFDSHGGRAGGAETAATLKTVVETVRRVMRADTASVASISLKERIITWHAMSGFLTLEPSGGEIVNPLRGEFAERAAEADEDIIEVRGLAGDLPVSEFPLHSAEGVRDLALVALRARGEALGILAVGYRASHRFNAEERQQLEGLAEMAALALDNARLFETLGTAKRVWEQTFDAIPDGVIVHDDRMLVARCNLAAAEMMGFHPSEVTGMTCAEAFARLFGERAAAYHMKQGGAHTSTSFELQAEDGRRYLVSVAPITSLESGGWNPESEIKDRRPSDSRQASPADAPAASQEDAQTSQPSQPSQTPESATRTYWSVITWSDITALSEVQEQLARARRLATIGQLAAGVAHEINNPLAAITTCAEATLRDLRAVPETAPLIEERNWNFYLEEIVRQALRCKQITRGLLDLARQKRARREPCDLNRLVERTARLFEQRGGERGVKVGVALDPLIKEVATDEGMVRQVLDNLLSNALDATGEGGHVIVSTALEGERVRVEVKDNGPGIAPDTLARVFDPFFTTKDPGSGSGLGLAISLSFAEELGGALTVESKPGAGSCFRLWLPRRTPEKSGQ
ncbi:MAG TPA: ATP-binding protein [Pyrinomonadaceae bacterium]|nr:ATP-binding protein [Pyrinomonadaceae bacterium]